MRTLLRWGARLFVVLLGLFVLYNMVVFTMLIIWRTHNPESTRFMRQSLAILQSKQPDAKLQHQWVPYAQISVSLKRAVIAAEDDKFVDHAGFDWESIEHALENNQKKGRPVIGGSTITQQLAKNLFLTPQRSMARKAEEALITLMIETLWDKKRILEVYLNVAEWGEGIFGCEAAAQYYYKSHASQLNHAQAARLAVMLPNPKKYQNKMPAYLLKHAAKIERRMQLSDIPD